MSGADSGEWSVNGDAGFDSRWHGAVIVEAHWHLHRQLHRRYGVVMAPGDFSDMMAGLRSGAATLVESKARRRAIYAWRLKTTGHLIFVLASGGTPFTVWPSSKHLLQSSRAALSR